MFKTVLNWLGSAIFVSALVVFTGCGGTESGIEGEEEVIAVELTAHDSGDSSSDPTFTIDVVQDVCGTPDEETPAEVPAAEEPAPEEPAAEEEVNANIEELTAEPYYDTLGKAIFHYIFYCPTCPPGADETYIIDSYSVQYVPLKSPDRKGGFFLPPQLVSLDQRPIVNRIILSKDFKTEERSLILISVNTKEEFVGKSDIADTPKSGAFYDILVYFHGRNRAGGSFTTTSGVQVIFGNYNNCSS